MHDTSTGDGDSRDVLEDEEDIDQDVNEELSCMIDSDCQDDNPCTTDACEAAIHACTNTPVDQDQDGFVATEVDGVFCGGTDCNDTDELIFPGRPRIQCSPIDNDCNGYEDRDNDGDTHMDWECELGDDCDDTNPEVLRGECWGVNPCCDGCNQINGCWMDETTGFLWVDPSDAGYRTWGAAIEYCESLALDGVEDAEWHLPSISELRTLIRGCPSTEVEGICGVTDSCTSSGDSCHHDCDGCAAAEGPGAAGCYWDSALEGAFDWYWSSTSCFPFVDSIAWLVKFGSAEVKVTTKVTELGVRCISTL